MFSLIVCSVGRTDELGRLFDSLERQTEQAFEVILVDQNTDGRLDSLVEKYEQKLALVRVFSLPGLSRARNEGLKHVKGDVIAFPDDDCTYPPELLGQITELLKTERDGVTVMSRDSCGAVSGPNWLCRAGPLTKCTVWRQAISYTIFIKRSCLFWADTFDTALGVGSASPWQAGEETDFLLRLMNAGVKLWYEPRLHVVHPTEGGSILERQKKAYRYGLGIGYVARLHCYPVWFRAKLLGGPLLRCMIGLAKGDRWQAALNWSTLSGRFSALFGRFLEAGSCGEGLRRASIVISNFNHGRFLSHAVESALQQTYPNTEVIVVDDGSTDDSLRLLEPYLDRVQLIAKENGGQASCYNAGFLRCSGNVVLFLDADDYLTPECIERVLRHWTDSVSKAHFYLAVVDEHSKPIGAVVPSGRIANADGALRMMNLFGSYAAPPASGNIFSAAFLRKILPFQNETELVHSADAVPIYAAPYFGFVVAIRETLGFYRRHSGANTSTRTYFDAEFALEGLRAEHKRDLLRDRSWRLASGQLTAAAHHLLDPSRAKRRLCYLRLSGGSGLVEGDTQPSLLRQGVSAVWRWDGYTFLQKISATVWFFLVSFLPLGSAKGLIRIALALGERTRWQKRLLTETQLPGPIAAHVP